MTLLNPGIVHDAVHVVGQTTDLLAVDKPAGLPSVPGRKPELMDCLWHRLQRTHPEALVVHRLDMATSGVMVFARHAQAQSAMSRAFAQRRVDKRYVALVRGVVSPELNEGVIDAPMLADWPNRPRQRIDFVHGRQATTHWRVLRRDAGHTLLELKPLTGRSHQLRVHLASIGHPIVGDTLYGPEATSMAATASQGLAATMPRLHLHAWTIEGAASDPRNPGDVTRWRFETELPAWAWANSP